MKIAEIYAIPVDKDGWRLLPGGNRLMIGPNVQAPDGIKLSSIGEGARIGQGVRIDEGSIIGAWVSIGAWVRIGQGARIGERARIGEESSIGARAKICAWAKIGERARIGDGAEFKKSPLAVQGSRGIAIQHSPGKIAVECEVHTYAQWKRHYKSIGKANGYTPEEIEEYGRILDFLIANSAPAEEK